MKPTFVCVSCQYRFKKNFQPRLCPYCGKRSVEPFISRGAQDILDEMLNS